MKGLTTSSDELDIYSINDIEDYADVLGVDLKSSNIGIYLKLEAISRSEQKTIGYITGFVRPLTGLLQLETIQVRNRRQSLDYKTIPKGVSFVLGCWALRWAYSYGCKRAELLAVRDDPMMEGILVRLYQTYGYKIKDTIEENNIAGRLVWGAVGTLMEIDIEDFLYEWTPKIRQMLFDAEVQ